MREFTQEKGLINAVSVENFSGTAPHSLDIREFTLQKGLMSAVNVENSLGTILH